MQLISGGGKVKLVRNKKNLGESYTTRTLLTESIGKYIGLLHSDDMYMPGALKHLYEVAEITNADVVHMPNRLRSGRDGVVNADTKLYMQSLGGEKIDKVTVMPKDPLFRLQMWVNKSITGDAPFNLFKRQFLVENNFVNIFHSQAFLLLWLMKADVFVETPLPLYIYRDSPDSTTRNNNLFPIERVL